MKAKSEYLREGTAQSGAEKKNDKVAQARLPHAERKAQILQIAYGFFAENGLTAQTRRLADACGISQRLLYRFFPTKEDMVEEVYRREVLGAFKAVWLAELQDRRSSVELRLFRFYKDYVASTLTRKWLRLFMYASLSEANMAPNYISAIITQLLEVIMRETALEKGLYLPNDLDTIHEMGWTLHGAISHYAIRRHLYGASNLLPEQKVIAMHVRIFLAGFEAMIREYDSPPY